MPGSPSFKPGSAVSSTFLRLPAAYFGLLGGYLTDLFGRRRVLTFSILIYRRLGVRVRLRDLHSDAAGPSVFRRSSVCAWSSSPPWRGWPSCFPEPKLREKVLGYTQACSSLGGLLVAHRQRPVCGLCRPASRPWPAFGMKRQPDPHAPWRYTLMSGVIPAIPLILIRPFLPESPTWQQKKSAGTLKRPSYRRVVRCPPSDARPS